MTTDHLTELYHLFTASGLKPDEAAALVDGIAELDREQRRKLLSQLKAAQARDARPITSGPAKSSESIPVQEYKEKQ